MTQERRLTVHIGVSPGLQRKLAEGGKAAVAAFGKELKLTGIDVSRVDMFGIVTCRALPEAVDRIRKYEGVDFVEIDKTRKAI